MTQLNPLIFHIVELDDMVPTIENIANIIDEPAFLHAKKALSDRGYLDRIKPGTFVCIEYPYVEKVYRDLYYNYYSKNYSKYSRDSIRLSFFEKKLEIESFYNGKLQANLKNDKNKFLGYITLRPTDPNIIGQSIISPDLFLHDDMWIRHASYQVHLNGVELQVAGFPHTSQDGEAITCAEVSIWSLMEYFGNKYPTYSYLLPSAINRILRGVSFERQIPSKGLQIELVAYTLKKVGVDVKMYTKKKVEENFGKKSFEMLFNDYIESGIPFLAAVELPSGKRHAFNVIGHGNVSDVKPNFAQPYFENNGLKIVDSCFLKKREYVVVDEGRSPYSICTFTNPLAGHNLAGGKIIGIVVPLYQKIYLDAIAARNFIKEIITSEKETIKFPYPHIKKIITRILLTSSSSFKKFVVNETKRIPLQLKEHIISINMSRFIWLAECYDEGGYPSQSTTANCLGWIVIDSASSTKDFYKSILLVLYKDCYIIKGKTSALEKIYQDPIELDVYISNLKKVNNNEKTKKSKTRSNIRGRKS